MVSFRETRRRKIQPNSAAKCFSIPCSVLCTELVVTRASFASRTSYLTRCSSAATDVDCASAAFVFLQLLVSIRISPALITFKLFWKMNLRRSTGKDHHFHANCGEVRLNAETQQIALPPCAEGQTHTGAHVRQGVAPGVPSTQADPVQKQCIACSSLLAAAGVRHPGRV